MKERQRADARLSYPLSMPSIDVSSSLWRFISLNPHRRSDPLLSTLILSLHYHRAVAGLN